MRICLKQISKTKAALGAGEVRSGFRSNPQKRVMRGAGDVILNLGDERGDEVKRLVDVGKLVQQFDHAVIVFECVETHPGQAIFA